MEILDIGCLLFVLAIGVLAFSHGLIFELLIMAGWAAAVALTCLLFPIVQPIVELVLEPGFLAQGVATVPVFLPTLLVLLRVARTVSDGMSNTTLGVIDRPLGISFGILRGTFLITLFLAVITRGIPESEQPDWLRSAAAPELARNYGMPCIEALVSEAFVAKVRGDFDAALGRARKAAAESQRRQTQTRDEGTL